MTTISMIVTTTAQSNNNDKHSSIFQKYHHQLTYLERWRELAIRPSMDHCCDDDKDLLMTNDDDIDELQRRVIHARQLMNDHLPHYIISQKQQYTTRYEKDLIPRKSGIRNAGMGLFYNPPPPAGDSQIIAAGEIICYYWGHLHNFHSMKFLKDSSYLMLVGEDLMVDPGPLPELVKARYINDPLNIELVNCRYVPELSRWRSAVVALRNICAGEELFASYGDGYWACRKVQGTVHSV